MLFFHLIHSHSLVVLWGLDTEDQAVRPKSAPRWGPLPGLLQRRGLLGLVSVKEHKFGERNLPEPASLRSARRPPPQESAGYPPSYKALGFRSRAAGFATLRLSGSSELKRTSGSIKTQHSQPCRKGQTKPNTAKQSQTQPAGLCSAVRLTTADVQLHKNTFH